MVNKFYSAFGLMIAAFALLSLYIQENALMSVMTDLLYFSKFIGVVLLVISSAIFLSLINDLHRYYDKTNADSRHSDNNVDKEIPIFMDRIDERDSDSKKYSMYPRDESPDQDFWK